MPSIYVDKDMQIVPAGDPRAARLAWREGGFVDEQRLEAMRAGLAKEVKAAIAAQTAKREPARAVAEEKAAAEPENKAVEAPSENKAAPRAIRRA